MAQKRLESDLQPLQTFRTPKVHLEQYHTPPKIAAYILHLIGLQYDDIIGKNILDLGCGNGILGLGCIRMEAAHVVGVDIDQAAIQVAQENADQVGLSSEVISFVNCDVRKLTNEHLPKDMTIDTVISNPPFGTVQKNVGIDYEFVQKGLELANVVYSLHKSSTRDFWIKSGSKLGASVEFVIQNLQFGIERTFKFHKKEVYEVDVDLIRFQKSHAKTNKVM